MLWTHHLHYPPPLNCLNFAKGLACIFARLHRVHFSTGFDSWQRLPDPWNITRKATRGKTSSLAVNTPLLYWGEAPQFYCIFTIKLGHSLGGCMSPKDFWSTGSSPRVLWFDSAVAGAAWAVTGAEQCPFRGKIAVYSDSAFCCLNLARSILEDIAW